jgi:hypothetical protein
VGGESPLLTSSYGMHVTVPKPAGHKAARGAGALHVTLVIGGMLWEAGGWVPGAQVLQLLRRPALLLSCVWFSCLIDCVSPGVGAQVLVCPYCAAG